VKTALALSATAPPIKNVLALGLFPHIHSSKAVQKQENAMRTSKITAAVGIALLLMIGAIHFATARDSFGDATYKGILFVANGVGSLIAAFGVARGVRTWGWGLGLLIAVSAFVGYALSRTVGLPMLPAEPDKWFEPMGIASFAAEGALSLLVAWVLTHKVEARQQHSI